MHIGVERILENLPANYSLFTDTEYQMPVSQAILGELPDLNELRRWLAQVGDGPVKDICEPAAIAAEIIESLAADRDLYFMDDARVRTYVFRGAKWRAGWVLVAGAGVTNELVGKLKAENYMVFSARHEGLRDRALPPRETAAVYFLQLMVRYAMIWGQIPPGRDHEMGHFLEQDMPGAMVVRGDVGHVEGLVLLALMKMGCPAVVGPDFLYEVGPRAVARTDDDTLKALGGFPNMRVRIFGEEIIALPDGADPAYAREDYTPARTLRGLFQLRPGHGDGTVVVLGDGSDDRVTVVVDISDEKLDLPVSAHLEAQAIRFGSYLQGVQTRRDDYGTYLVELAENTTLDAHLLGEVIQASLRRQYPRLGPARVRILLGEETLQREAPGLSAFARRRDMAILAESEKTVDEFHLCIDCQPFSHTHVCVITPDRPPMCGRNRNEIKAAALWGADYRPWTRREVGAGDLQHVVTKGEPIDETAGEWSSLNAAVSQLTGGRVERVRIHSVGDVPHTSCGCFGALAFRIPGTDGIGVMDRGYTGTAPGQLTWSILANRAGGKQAPGVTGITLKYLESPRAFAGEGGLTAVKWATKRVLEIMRPHLPSDARVATEEEATSLSELMAFQGIE